MAVSILLFLAACFLAYSNGANDNFKGVATLFGSRTANYKWALWWATVTTFAGSVLSIVLAESLVDRFSGRGLVPDTIAASPKLLLAVAISAGLVVILATVLGFPISTTHSLTGALLGSGLVAAVHGVNLTVLGNSFFLPLLLSPLIAIGLGFGSYTLFRRLGMRLGISEDWCLCVSETERPIPILQPESALSHTSVATLNVALDTEVNCTERYAGRVLRVGMQNALDLMHTISAGTVSFARGLNDTPKIVALLLSIKALGLESGMLAVAVGMAVGGLLSGRNVAETMSNKITPLTHAHGFTANIVTALLVVFASGLGIPVSTTHVSVGSLVGIGLVTRAGNFRLISEILLAWVLTLPLAAILSGGIYWILP